MCVFPIPLPLFIFTKIIHIQKRGKRFAFVIWHTFHKYKMRHIYCYSSIYWQRIRPTKWYIRYWKTGRNRRCLLEFKYLYKPSAKFPNWQKWLFRPHKRQHFTLVFVNNTTHTATICSKCIYKITMCQQWIYGVSVY